MPGAPDAIQAFVNLAKRRGVKRLVLLSGRGEEVAQACERIVQGAGLEWTIVRASWFNQNFSEGALYRHGVERRDHLAGRRIRSNHSWMSTTSRM